MKKTIIIGLCAALTVTSFTSCLDTENDRFVEAGKQLTPQDSVYQMLGVLTNLKALSSRYVLLGELRADLMMTTDYATTDLKELSNWDITNANNYVSQAEYYKIINQCNYIIQYGAALPKERAAAITFRAWTYLQLVLNYGKATFYEQFIDNDKLANQDYPEYNLAQLVAEMIPQLEAIKDINFPSYGTIGGVDLRTQFLDPKFVLADLYLWKNGSKEDYKRAAQLYYDLIVGDGTTGNIKYTTGYTVYDNTSGSSTINYIIGGVYAKWMDESYSSGWFDWNRLNRFESISYVNLPNQDSTVVRSNLDSLCGYPYYERTADPKYVSIKASRVASTIWSTTNYAYIRDESQYILYPYLKYVEPETANYDAPGGDLRVRGSYTTEEVMGTSFSSYSRKDFADSIIYKYWNQKDVSLQRVGSLYLRYAEAVNRAGHPNLAMIALKYGLTDANVFLYMPSNEKPDLVTEEMTNGEGDLVTVGEYGYFMYDQKNKQALSRGKVGFPVDTVTKYNGMLYYRNGVSMGGVLPSDTLVYFFNPNIEAYYDFSSSYMDRNVGFHSRGAGFASADTTFKMPVHVYPSDLAAQQVYMDSVICREYALETAFEGNRFHDLMRFSLYQNDPKFLATRVANKFGTRYDEFYSKILTGNSVNGWDDAAWYLPKKNDEK